MKFHEPRDLSFLTSGVVTITYILLFLLTAFLLFPHSLSHFSTILLLISSSFVLFLITFLIFRYTIERFIYSKIRLIYKSIHSFKTGKKERPLPHYNNGMLESVQKEVEHWEDEKQQEIDRLQQLEQYRREFIGNVSHELKTPLFNIEGYVETLLDGGLEDPAINREYLKRTGKSVERLIRIVEDLDEIGQLESGSMRLNITKFNIVALAREVVEMLDIKALKKNIQLSLNGAEQTIWVEGDHEKIRQVLTNIIDNSIRYGSNENGRTKVSFFDMDENILVEITDNGIGIEKDELPRVFERFYRTERGRSISKKGKGLGLSIVKHILEAHDQTINVRSTIGVGTTFGFTLKKV
ncbi:MAG: ATP-binding protein [bacterium]